MRTVSGGLYGFEGGLLAICRAFFSVMSPGAGQGLVVFSYWSRTRPLDIYVFLSLVDMIVVFCCVGNK